MKATDVIKELERLVKDCGDLEVFCKNNDGVEKGVDRIVTSNAKFTTWRVMPRRFLMQD